MITACSIQNEFMVSRPGEEQGKALSSFVYVLPQTVLHLELTIIKETYIPGPYYNFAPSYLGISNIIEETYENWELGPVKLKYLTEPDSANYFTVNLLSGKPDFSNFITLTNQGLVIDPLKWTTDHKSELTNYPSIIKPPYFTDLSLTDYFREITDTLYKTIITDTSFIQVPIPRRQRTAKTIEQKAEEAAGFILNLREARFDLLSGEIDSFPGGEALQFAINELNKLEQSYLELFTGKKIKQAFRASVFILPNGNTQQFNLINLISAQGLKEFAKYKGEAITLHITPARKISSLQQLKTAEDTQSKNQFIYRIPDIAVFKIMKGDAVFFEERATLYQAGKLVNLPMLE